MKHKDFFIGASVLAFAGFVTKFIGALYRIPLTNVIGAEGIGIYQLIFSVYALFLTSSAGGLPTGLSKLIAETKANEKDSEISGILGSALGFVGLTSLIFSAALIAFSRPLAAMQGNTSASLGYAVIAPAIFFVGIISVLRGYFQGNLNMKPTALSQITEQIVKLAAGLTLAAVMIKKGALYGAVGAILGVVASELAAAVYLYVLFLGRGGRMEIAANPKKLRTDFKKVAKYSIPITIGGALMPLTQFADGFLVINILNGTGFAPDISTSLYGILTGPVSSLVNFPVVITISLAVVIIPVISRQKSCRNIKEILSKSNFAVKTALFIGIPAAILFIAFSEEIMRALYPNFSVFELLFAARLLRLSAAGIIFLAVTHIFTALLQALDKPFLPVANMAVAMVLKIVLNIVLIRAVGITGAAVATVIAYFIAAFLNFIALSRLIGTNGKILRAFVKTLAAGACMTCFILVFKGFIENLYLRLLITAVGGAFLYLVVMLYIGLFTDEELRELPFGKKLLGIRGVRKKV